MDKPVPFWLIFGTVVVLVGISVGIYLWLERIKREEYQNREKE